MAPPLDPASRPSRLPLLVHVATLFLLIASFVTGVLVWRGQVIQLQEMTTPSWLNLALVIHGCLNPLVCGLIGYLACQHIRLGWKLRANLVSGIPLEVTLLGLAITGLGLYYAGSEDWRNALILTHRVLGLLLPASLIFHLVMARRWVKNNSN